MRKSNRFSCSLHEAEDVGKACCLYAVRVGGMSRGQDGGVAEVVCSPLGWWCVRGGHAQYPAFLPSPPFCSRLFTSCSWVFLFSFLVSFYFCLELAPLHKHKIIFGAHAISLHFVAVGDMCPYTSIAAKGLRFQTVS